MFLYLNIKMVKVEIDIVYFFFLIFFRRIELYLLLEVSNRLKYKLESYD